MAADHDILQHRHVREQADILKGPRQPHFSHFVRLQSIQTTCLKSLRKSSKKYSIKNYQKSIDNFPLNPAKRLKAKYNFLLLI